MLTQQQIRWAADHDWFSRQLADTIEVIERWAEPDGKGGMRLRKELRVWDGTFAQLREWAGY